MTRIKQRLWNIDLRETELRERMKLETCTTATDASWWILNTSLGAGAQGGSHLLDNVFGVGTTGFVSIAVLVDEISAVSHIYIILKWLVK